MTIRKNQFNDNLLLMGNKLRTLRKGENLTISKFSEEVGLSEKIICNYENGKNLISIESIIKIYRSKVFSSRTLTEILDILIVSIYEEET